MRLIDADASKMYERLDIQTEGGGVNEQSTANLI